MNEIAHIRRRTQVYRQTVFQNQLRIRRSREEHGHIVEAVLAGDAAAAYQHMIEHIAIGGVATSPISCPRCLRGCLPPRPISPVSTAAERQRVEATRALERTDARQPRRRAAQEKVTSSRN